MKLSISTLVCPNWTVDELIANCVRYGVQGVELSGSYAHAKIGPDMPPEERQALRAQFAEAGVAIIMVNAYTKFITDHAQAQQVNWQTVADFAQLAHELGAPAVRILGHNQAQWQLPAGLERDRCVELLTDGIDRSADIAAEHGVAVYVETHDVFGDPYLLRDVLAGATRSNTGVIWDVPNSMRSGASVNEVFNCVKDHMTMGHIKDFKDGVPCLLGEGDYPCREPVMLWNQIGFDGYVSLETEKHYNPQPEAPDADVSVPQFVEKMREYLA